MPTAKIETPSDGAFVKGLVQVNVSLNGLNFDRAELYIDEKLVEAWSLPGKHMYLWNTSTYSDGPHTIELSAYDKAGGRERAAVRVIVDNTPPSLGEPSWNPREPSVEESVTVTIPVVDNVSGVANVTLYACPPGVSPAFMGLTIKMTFKDGVWRGTIPAQRGGVTIEFYIVAYDQAGNMAITKTYSYKTKTAWVYNQSLIYLIGVGIGAGIFLLTLIARKRRLVQADWKPFKARHGQPSLYLP